MGTVSTADIDRVADVLSAPVRIALVDPHPIMRRGLVAALGDCPDFEVVGEHASVEAALASLDGLRPDVVVMDCRLSGMSGVAACRALRALDERCRIVVLTSFPTDAVVVDVLGIGGSAVITKESHDGILVDAIRCVVAGGTYIDPWIAGRVVSAALVGWPGVKTPARASHVAPLRAGGAQP